MKSMCIHLNTKADLDTVWQELELLGVAILYSDEDENGQKIIYANLQDEAILNDQADIDHFTPFVLPAIDWEQQFKDHGMNFYEGYVHVDLKEFGCQNPKFNPIKIKPGPGFGDLSHPTTRLVLKLMNGKVFEKDVLDIGCGSGILSLAAISMGAASCFGVDIDDEAITHSILNSDLNGLSGNIHFGKSVDYKPNNPHKPLLVLMNMVQSEQVEAYLSLKQMHQIQGSCLISGILKKDVSHYMSFAKANNWTLNSMIEEDGWLGLHFTRHPQ